MCVGTLKAFRHSRGEHRFDEARADDDDIVVVLGLVIVHRAPADEKASSPRRALEITKQFQGLLGQFQDYRQ